MLPPMQPASIRFGEGETDVLGVIEIDAPLGIGGPEVLWQTLFELRLQIVSAQFRVAGDRLLQTLHVCEEDGASVTPPRARELRTGLDRVLLAPGPKGPRRARLRGVDASRDLVE